MTNDDWEASINSRRSVGITACHLWLGFKMKGIETKIDTSNINGCAVWVFSLL